MDEVFEKELKFVKGIPNAWLEQMEKEVEAQIKEMVETEKTLHSGLVVVDDQVMPVYRKADLIDYYNKVYIDPCPDCGHRHRLPKVNKTEHLVFPA